MQGKHICLVIAFVPDLQHSAEEETSQTSPATEPVATMSLGTRVHHTALTLEVTKVIS